MCRFYSLVESETNKFIHDSYHHKKYIDRYNMKRFISLLKRDKFKEHKEFNEISSDFPISAELLSKAILDELQDKGYEKRLEVFFNDLNNVIKKIECILPEIDITVLKDYIMFAKKYSFSSKKDLPLARASMQNFVNAYIGIEEKILNMLMTKLSTLVEHNYTFNLGNYHYDSDEKYNNIIEQKIEKYISLLYMILLSKNITKKEIVDIFEKLTSEVRYFKCKGKSYFDCKYPHSINYDDYKYNGYYYFDVSKHVENLNISDRFKKFIDLLNHESECFYVFQILNTELYKTDELTFGDITYYNENIYKTKGWKNIKNDEKEKFGKGKHVKAILKYKSKKYFSNISFLKARQVVENNISLLKLLGNRRIKENVELFKPDVSSMDVSYSYYLLDENYYMIGGYHTVYDGNFSYEKNIIYNEFFNDKVFEKQLNIYITQINHKQRENYLSEIDLIILQSLNKFKKSVESTNFTDVLLNTWNAFEFLTKAFSLGVNRSLTNNEKLEKIIYFVNLVYSFIYTNKYYRWDLTNKKAKDIIKHKSNRLIIYSYFYRNKIVHEHLIENPLMISITRGLNIILANLLNLIIEKIIFIPDYNMDDIFKQIESDLEKHIKNIE